MYCPKCSSIPVEYTGKRFEDSGIDYLRKFQIEYRGRTFLISDLELVREVQDFEMTGQPTMPITGIGLVIKELIEGRSLVIVKPSDLREKSLAALTHLLDSSALDKWAIKE